MNDKLKIYYEENRPTSMDNNKWIVELEGGCWLANWDGDPGRTCKFSYAKQFRLRGVAKLALCKAKTYRPFMSARIVRVNLIEVDS